MILCWNEPKILPNRNFGICQLHCTCYVLKLHWWIKEKNFNKIHQTSAKQHEGRLKFIKSYRTHKRQSNWINSKTLAILSYMYKKKVWEKLEINKLQTLNTENWIFKVLNRHVRDSLTTNMYKPLFINMGNHWPIFWP